MFTHRNPVNTRIKQERQLFMNQCFDLIRISLTVNERSVKFFQGSLECYKNSYYFSIQEVRRYQGSRMKQFQIFPLDT